MEWGQRPVQNLCNMRPNRNVKSLFVHLMMYLRFYFQPIVSLLVPQLLILLILPITTGVSKKIDGRGRWGCVHESSVASPVSEWQRERVREMLSICQRKQFSWFGCKCSLETVWLTSEKIPPPSRSFPFFPPANSQAHYSILCELLVLSDWTLFFPVAIYLTKSNVLYTGMLLNCTRLAQLEKAKNVIVECFFEKDAHVYV